MWLSRFVVLILGVRELLWFPPKLVNFPKICNICCRIGKYFKSFLWICDSAAVDNVMVNGGIIMGRNCWLVWLYEFVVPISSVRELLRFLPKLANFPENWDADCREDKRSGSSPWTCGLRCVDGNVVEGEGYWPVRLFKFVVLICSVRELLWFLLKSVNFLRICDTRYLGSE